MFMPVGLRQVSQNLTTQRWSKRDWRKTAQRRPTKQRKQVDIRIGRKQTMQSNCILMFLEKSSFSESIQPSREGHCGPTLHTVCIKVNIKLQEMFRNISR